VLALFFAWGLATVLIDTLIPKLKGLFALDYAEAMLTQFAFFLAYLVASIPAGLLVSRVGYLRGIVVGLAVMGAGCLMVAPAAWLGIYWGFLAALFVMAAGITILQVAANPLIARLGSPESAHSRLTLAQALNSLGTFVGPFVGAAVILRGGVGPIALHAVTRAAARSPAAWPRSPWFSGVCATRARRRRSRRSKPRRRASRGSCAGRAWPSAPFPYSSMSAPRFPLAA
jgi:FHS family L-fucose permease-like MFS transporter